MCSVFFLFPSTFSFVSYRILFVNFFLKVRVLIFDGNLEAFGGKFVLAWTWRLTFFLLHASCFHFFFRERAFCPRCKRGKQVPSSLLSVRLNLTAVRNLFF